MPIPTPASLLTAMTGAPTLALSGRRARMEPVAFVFGLSGENFRKFAQLQRLTQRNKRLKSNWPAFLIQIQQPRVYPYSEMSRRLDLAGFPAAYSTTAAKGLLQNPPIVTDCL
jgi:hypothetical protein